MIRHVTTLSLLALVASCTTQPEPPPKPAFDSSRNPDWLAPDLYLNVTAPKPGGGDKPRSRNNHGQVRDKRSDAGKPRKK